MENTNISDKTIEIKRAKQGLRKGIKAIILLILNVGDKVLFRKRKGSDKLYEGIIKSIQNDKIEIDDSTIKLVIIAISKGTIADNLTFKKR